MSESERSSASSNRRLKPASTPATGDADGKPLLASAPSIRIDTLLRC